MTSAGYPGSLQGSPYKSQPERRIACLLDQYHLPFIYEKPTAVVDAGKTKIWFPDFSLQYGLLIEYFGINGDRGYQERTRHKLTIYQANQYDVLPLYPTDMSGQWQDRLLRRVELSLENRLSDYRSRIIPARRSSGYARPSGY